MVKKKKSESLNELIIQWDGILKATGFKDIEKNIRGERVLIQFASNCYKQADELTVESKRSYYDQIQYHLHRQVFDNSIDQTVMTMIGEGHKINQVVEALGRRGHRIHRQTCRFIIRRYEVIWGMRVWTHKQMNLKTPTR